MTTTVKLITYNTHLFEGMLIPTLMYEEKTRKEHILKQIEREDPDIICLQEVWSDCTRQWFLDNINSSMTGFYPNEGQIIGTSGLLILSKHSIRNTRFTAFKDAAGSDGLAAKGYLSATIQRTDGKVLAHIITTHTQANEGAKNKKVRTSQFAQITLAIQKLQQDCAGKNEPVILCGDFNVIGELSEGTRITQEYQDIIKKMSCINMIDIYREVYPEDNLFIAPGYTYNLNINKLAQHFDPHGQPQEQRLDYIFLDRSNPRVAISQCRVDEDLWIYPTDSGLIDLSDHFPLLLEYEME